MNKRLLIVIVLFGVISTEAIAQTGEAPVPTETIDPGGSVPVSEVKAPTVMPTQMAPRAAPPSATLVATPTPLVSPVTLTPVVENPATENNSVFYGLLITLTACVVGAFGYGAYVARTKKKDADGRRCDGIKDLLEQKKKELEEMIAGWPEDKLKEAIKKRAASELKRNEDVKEVLEATDAIQAKYNKLNKAIELLQTKYDLCMLKLPPIPSAKPILYIMCGVGFSGKSTLAKNIAEHFNIPLISQDGLYFEKKDELKLSLDDDEQWRMLLDMCKGKIKELLQKGTPVVFDNVNLRREHRDELRALADEAGADTVVIYMDTPEEVLVQRQEANKISKERHDVEQEYLDEAKRELEIPADDENVRVFTPKTDLKDWLTKLLSLRK